MVHAIMRSIFRIGFTHKSSGEGVDYMADIHSDDSNAFAGVGMHVIFNLESACICRGKQFLGEMYLHSSTK